ncbi:MAG: BamA/TamA family outer membrane protein, partial [Saprospiraceae bacterium]
MNKLHLILSLFFSFVFISVAIAQDAPSDTIKVEKKQRWLRKSTLIPLPIAFYTPETRFGGGAATLFAFRFGKQTDEDRPSQVQLGLAYTQERQIIAYFPFQVFTKDAEYYYKGEIGYYRYSYRFYGIGNDVPKENEERFQVDFPRFRLDAQKLVKPNLYFGFRYWFDNYKITEKLEGGLLDTQTITGQNGSRISGLGLISTYDTRDIIFFPRKGYFIESELFFNQKWTGSDFDYMRITIDATKYIPLGKKPTLAINAYGVSLHGNV